MSEVQNERTESKNRRRPRRSRGERNEEQRHAQVEVATPVAAFETPVAPAPPKEVRPAEIAAPTEKLDVYCVYHSVSLVEEEPVLFRSGMTTLRHLPVDRFGSATLYCDCMHNGPHAWPPSMQKLETAVELDQFLTASTNEA